MIVGGQWGITASLLMYAHLSGKGFSLLPFSAGNATGYAKIGFSFLALYMMGFGWVKSRFGDNR